MIKPSNFQKILECNYENTNKQMQQIGAIIPSLRNMSDQNPTPSSNNSQQSIAKVEQYSSKKELLTRFNPQAQVKAI
jgi:hypothetical protein